MFSWLLPAIDLCKFTMFQHVQQVQYTLSFLANQRKNIKNEVALGRASPFVKTILIDVKMDSSCMEYESERTTGSNQ
jgi:hypothetical protein